MNLYPFALKPDDVVGIMNFALKCAGVFPGYAGVEGDLLL